MQLLNHEKNHAILRLYHLLHDSVKRVHFVVNVIVAEERKEKNDGREDELAVRYGRAEQVEIFRNAGRKAGEFFARKMLNLNQPLDQFVGELQKKMAEMKIGVLRIESVDEESGQIILTVSEDADCSGLPVLGETVCNYDEGFISGILSLYSGKEYVAVETDCWATGGRVCRFQADVREGDS